MDPAVLDFLRSAVALVVSPLLPFLAGLSTAVIAQWMARKTVKQQIEAQDAREKINRAREDRFRHVEPQRASLTKWVSLTVRFIASLKAIQELERRVPRPTSYEELQIALLQQETDLLESIHKEWPDAYAEASIYASEPMRMIGQVIGIEMQAEYLMLNLTDGTLRDGAIEEWNARLENMTQKMAIELGTSGGSGVIESPDSDETP